MLSFIRSMAQCSPLLAVTLILTIHLGFRGVNSSLIHTKLNAEQGLNMYDEDFLDENFIVERNSGVSSCGQYAAYPQVQDEKCKPRPAVIPVKKAPRWDIHYSPQFVELYQCQGSCHMNALGGKRKCQSTTEEDVHLRVSWRDNGKTNCENIVLKNHTSCSCACAARFCPDK